MDICAATKKWQHWWPPRIQCFSEWHSQDYLFDTGDTTMEHGGEMKIPGTSTGPTPHSLVLCTPSGQSHADYKLYTVTRLENTSEARNYVWLTRTCHTGPCQPYVLTKKLCSVTSLTRLIRIWQHSCLSSAIACLTKQCMTGFTSKLNIDAHFLLACQKTAVLWLWKVKPMHNTVSGSHCLAFSWKFHAHMAPVRFLLPPQGFCSPSYPLPNLFILFTGTYTVDHPVKNATSSSITCTYMCTVTACLCSSL